MKSSFKTALLALSGAALFVSPAMGAVSLGAGSLAVAFYQVNGSNVVQPNTYVFDLGNASAYRENTLANASVSTIGGVTSSNIGADLAAAFGADWASSGTVRWLVVGSVGSTDPLTNGDPARTSYYSRGRGNLDVGTTIPTISQTNRGILNNNILSFYSGTNNATQTVGANPDGAIIGISAINSVNDLLPPTTLTYFGIGINPYQTLSSGNILNPIGTPLEGALDMYRVIDTVTDADLSAGFSFADAVPGTGQFVGTLLLDTAGNLSVIPEPTSALLGVFGSLVFLARRKRASN